MKRVESLLEQEQAIASEEVAEFTRVLTRSPWDATRYVGQLVNTAARGYVAATVATWIQGWSEGETPLTGDKLHAWILISCRDEVFRGAENPPASTNAGVNMAEIARTRAWARLLRKLS